MAFIKQEPLSTEQWDQFIKDFENQPDTCFPDYQDSALDQNVSSVDTTTNCQVKSEPVVSQLDWTFMDAADQPFEIPVNNEPGLSLDSNQVSSRLEEIKAMLEENSRQINGIYQHLVGLHPFFQAMRATLKALTQHVNPQWEVKTPTTPAKMQHGKGCDRH